MSICINDLDELPPLSNSAREILKLIQNDDADVDHFSRIIERDPALLSKIIGLANSAFYGTRVVTDVKRAIIDILGLRTAKNITLGIVLGGVFNPRQCQGFDLPRYWFESLVAATLAKEIAVELNVDTLDANNAYLSGMLNELGLMTLAYLHPAEMEKILAEGELSITDQEQEFFGQNHYEISAYLLEKWQLPDVITSVMLESSSTLPCDYSPLCCIVTLAQKLAHKIYNNETIDLAEMNLPENILEHATPVYLAIEKVSVQVENYRQMADVLS